MDIQRTEKGMASVTGIMLVIIIAAVVGVGWYVYGENQSAKLDNLINENTNQTVKTLVPPVNSKTDLEAITKTLSDVPLDTDLDTAALDADIQSLY